MRALQFDGQLTLTDAAPVPRRAGEALIEVLCAGICNTDLEIVKGYAGYRGILGHEFVGRVAEAETPDWIDKRVVGEINVGCRQCTLCQTGDSRHCAARTVLGIKGRDGAFADYLSLPVDNLLAVPDTISNEQAVFIEPLAAACHILEQVEIGTSAQVAVIGDGKLAQLILLVLAQTGCSLTMIGKHEEKLALARQYGAQVLQLNGEAARPQDLPVERLAIQMEKSFDVVIEASGSPTGLPLALRLLKPQGVLVLKSTHHRPTPIDLSLLVVKEIRLIGSRCGHFSAAINLLTTRTVDVAPFISHRLSLADGLQAFEQAALPCSRKVLLFPLLPEIVKP